MNSNDYIASSIALGTFDGLHLGHIKVIENAIKCRENEKPLILLFNEHPQKALTGDAPFELITGSLTEKLLKSMGITPIYIDFPDIMNLGCEDFIIKIAKAYHVRQISCGFNYRFGKNASGDCVTLTKLCADNGLRLVIAPPVLYCDEPISSTRIRRSVTNGDMKSASDMLGRFFSYDFTVEHGDRLGRQFGFPTINQYFPSDYCVPERGVYASRTLVDGSYYPSVTNIGIRPTIGKSDFRSETHIIGINDSLYGQCVQVELIKKLRNEKLFSSTEELRAQIKKDISCVLDESES